MNQIRYRSLHGYKYQLAETYEIQLPPAFLPMIPKVGVAHPDGRPILSLSGAGLLRIAERYSWDGPSGPTIDTPNFMRGSLVHDALYQLIRERLLPIQAKDLADRLLQRICREDGMSAARAWYVYQGVRWFAGEAAAPRSQEPIDEILVAP